VTAQLSLARICELSSLSFPPPCIRHLRAKHHVVFQEQEVLAPKGRVPEERRHVAGLPTDLEGIAHM